MVQTSHLLTIHTESQKVIERIASAFQNAGMQVFQSFDLQVARAAHTSCSCPHHGTEHCDCQMVVLLIYHDAGQPATLVAHGQDGRTHLSLMNGAAPEDMQRIDRLLQSVLV